MQHKHPVIYRIGYSFRALWTQTIYENIVIFCVIFSKMLFKMETCFRPTNVHTCGKCKGGQQRCSCSSLLQRTTIFTQRVVFDYFFKTVVVVVVVANYIFSVAKQLITFYVFFTTIAFRYFSNLSSVKVSSHNRRDIVTESASRRLNKIYQTNSIQFGTIVPCRDYFSNYNN